MINSLKTKQKILKEVEKQGSLIMSKSDSIINEVTKLNLIQKKTSNLISTNQNQDIETNYKLVKKLFENSSIILDLAQNGKEGIEILEKQSYDIILIKF